MLLILGILWRNPPKSDKRLDRCIPHIYMLTFIFQPVQLFFFCAFYFGFGNEFPQTIGVDVLNMVNNLLTCSPTGGETSVHFAGHLCIYYICSSSSWFFFGCSGKCVLDSVIRWKCETIRLWNRLLRMSENGSIGMRSIYGFQWSETHKFS